MILTKLSPSASKRICQAFIFRVNCNNCKDAEEKTRATFITFATLAFVKKMRAAGCTESQAEALREISAERLATKQDLKDLEMSLTLKIERLLLSNFAQVDS